MFTRIINKFRKTKLGPYLIKENPQITVGTMSYHNGKFIVQGSQKVKIGSYCAFGENINIITENHDYNYPVIQYTFYRNYFRKEHPGTKKTPPNRERTKGAVEIGNDVWIGHNATILSGVKIGNGAILGNGCVITKNVAPYAIVGGIPGRQLKMRFDEVTVNFLEEMEWWNWSRTKIVMNENFFNQDLNTLSLDEIKSLVIK